MFLVAAESARPMSTTAGVPQVTERSATPTPKRYNIYIYIYSFRPNFLAFLLRFFFLPFFQKSYPPEGTPPSWHQPGILSGTRASSDLTFSEANFRIDF